MCSDSRSLLTCRAGIKGPCVRTAVRCRRAELARKGLLMCLDSRSLLGCCVLLGGACLEQFDAASVAPALAPLVAGCSMLRFQVRSSKLEFSMACCAAQSSKLELIQSHMAQKPVLRGEVGCACVAREVSAERGGRGERGCAGRLGGWVWHTHKLIYHAPQDKAGTQRLRPS